MDNKIELNENESPNIWDCPKRVHATKAKKVINDTNLPESYVLLATQPDLAIVFLDYVKQKLVKELTGDNGALKMQAKHHCSAV